MSREIYHSHVVWSLFTYICPYCMHITARYLQITSVSTYACWKYDPTRIRTVMLFVHYVTFEVDLCNQTSTYQLACIYLHTFLMQSRSGPFTIHVSCPSHLNRRRIFTLFIQVSVPIIYISDFSLDYIQHIIGSATSDIYLKLYYSQVTTATYQLYAVY